MLVNADFSRTVIVTPDQHAWVASPQAGVERVMLDRVGAEQARATSLVSYAPQSFFPAHAHPRGEEILVLSGTFSDADGDCPAGTYIRNPPGSSHRPFSVDGATIFVKLRQMHPQDAQQVRIDTRDAANWRDTDGRDTCALYAGFGEQVCLQKLPPGGTLFCDPVPGAEILVLDGSLLYEGMACETGSWIRLPAGGYPQVAAGEPGVTLYLKICALPPAAAARPSG